MTTFKRGSSFPIPQGFTYDFDPQRGETYHEDHRGISLEQMQAKYGDYVNAGIACRLTYHHGIASLDVEDSSQAFTVDTWEIVGNDLSIDIFSNPKINGLISDEQMAAILGFLTEDATPAEAFADPALTSASAIVRRYYSMHQRGTTDYRRAQYVLRHTTNAPSRWNSNVSDVGVEKIYTTAQLLSETQNSGLWIYPMPGRLGYKVANIPTLSAANYQWGWLKAPSTETTTANNRINITTEYCLELWSTDLYTAF